MTKKRILFYLGHPAHYHNISKVIPELKKKGHKVFIVARDKDVLFNLIDDLPFDKFYLKNLKKDDSKVSLIYSVVKREIQILRLALKNKIDLMVGTDIVITHIGKFLGIPSLVLNEDDAAAVPLLAKFGFKYSTWTLSPSCCDINPYEDKKIEYNSYHELAYLHPNHFKPERDIVSKYIPLDDTPFFIMRFAKLNAHHDDNVAGISDEMAFRIVSELKPHGRIVITSERRLPKELEEYRLKVDPLDMHHLLGFASLYIGDSQTMAAEAGVLGTPFIRHNDFVGKLGYLEEIENNFNLGIGIKTDEQNKVIPAIKTILDTSKDIYKKRRDQMLESKIDYAAFMEWFIDGYPESANTVNNDPNSQYRFLKNAY